MRWIIQPGAHLFGSLRPPSSKSQSLRALLFAACATTPSDLTHVLISDDARAMIKACQELGASYEMLTPGRYRVLPFKNLFQDQRAILIDAGNSGIVWRFVTAIAAHRPGITLMTGDRSILFRRAIEPLLDALRQLKVECYQSQQESDASLEKEPKKHGPCLIKGPMSFKIPLAHDHALVTIDGFDSQPVSALLIAACLQEMPIELSVVNAKEVPWVKLTIEWLQARGMKIQADETGSFYQLEPKKPGGWPGFSYCVPADLSSSAFIIASAIVTQSKIYLEGLDLEDLQPDKVIIDLLKAANIPLEEQALLDGTKRLMIDGRASLLAFEIDLSGPIDLVPILCVLGCYATSTCYLHSIQGARLKESDRVESMMQELKKMGAKLELSEDQSSLRIIPAPLQGSHQLRSHADHRVAMALAIAALGAQGSSQIDGVECVNKTYELFCSDLQNLGAYIEQID